MCTQQWITHSLLNWLFVDILLCQLFELLFSIDENNVVSGACCNDVVTINADIKVNSYKAMIGTCLVVFFLNTPDMESGVILENLLWV